MDIVVADRAPEPEPQPAVMVGWTPRFSLTVITFARDAMLRRLIAHLGPVLKERRDVEFILVDNNPDALDRSAWLVGLGTARYVKLGANHGVRARNVGARHARGDILVFNDDDVLIEPADFLDRFAEAFDTDPRLGLVCARTVMADTGETPRAYFPHTNKQLPHDRTFKTFRFQANAFAIRRATYARVGLMADDFFYGLEEIDYAYRVIKAGFEILHLPAVRALEFNDPGGRRPQPAVERMRLANKFKISYLHMPLAPLLVNIPLFAVYVLMLNRGKVNVPGAFGDFVAWAWRNRARRAPIDRPARAYIRACGGQLWK
ncbi:MAG: glycosyltransferase [Proteobacteria bacterium]|nr:glycosyltransferase [Pseudomonadota bacterium]